jgi:hypothetical protein
MTPKSAMQEVVAQVESVTGYPVHVQSDPNLNVLATVKAANPSVPFTLVRVRPDNTGTNEYVVCFQCGFVLRQASLPEGEGWDIAAAYRGRKELDRVIQKSMAGKVSQDARSAFVENLLGGLIVQLRSVPIGLRVDQWIHKQYPALADQQRSSIERQLNDNLAVLSPNIKRMAPEVVYTASAAMNAAVAVYWSNEWDDNTLAVPYKAGGFMGIADRLLSRFREVDPAPEYDRTLIDLWASELGIAGWYEFVRR